MRPGSTPGARTIYKYLMYITVKNPQVLTCFDEVAKLDRSQGRIPRRPIDSDSGDYQAQRDFACADSTLIEYLSKQRPYQKIRSLDYFGETQGGKFFNDYMVPLLGMPRWYTSGYDPQGFLGWHEDTRESGYFLMFTYSREGRGFFKYLDNYSDTIITIPDSVGWSVKSGYTGHDQDDAWWHCVSAECARYTWIYIWDHQDQMDRAIEILKSGDVAEWPMAPDY